MRRPRKARTPAAPRTPGTRQATVGAVGGGELVQAAEEIADGARSNASSWSSSIPPNIRTEQVSEKQVNIVSDAGPAYPAETRSRHPLFGNRDFWYGPPGRPFLGPAADERAGAALAKYADKVDRMCREAGFK